MARFRALYGAGPLHLLATLASLALVGWAFFQIFDAPTALGTLAWFAGAIVAHDLLAFPLYSALSLLAARSLGGPAGAWEGRRRVPAVNHLRIPAYLSLLALLVFFPLILGLSASKYETNSGVDAGVFLGRWLGLCAALFLGSALIYALRLRRAARADRPGGSG